MCVIQHARVKRKALQMKRRKVGCIRGVCSVLAVLGIAPTLESRPSVQSDMVNCSHNTVESAYHAAR